MTPPSRFLSEPECAQLAKRVASFATGGGETSVSIQSTWSGNVRWTRNQISTSGDTRDQRILLIRTIHGASGYVTCNQIDDNSLRAAAFRAERFVNLMSTSREWPFKTHWDEAYSHPDIWSDATYALEADARAAAMRALVVPAERAGMLSAGYIEVSAQGRAVMDDQGRSMYYAYTQAQYSVTVRDPDGTGSGWAGMDHHDWAALDAETISARALDKCLSSRNPVAVEPGRYTAILEPQAVCDLMRPLVRSALRWAPGPFLTADGHTRIGERVLDERLTLGADPLDPLLGFAPFDLLGDVYQPVKWIDRGILRHLSYDRRKAIQELGKNEPLPNSGAFHLSGGSSSIEEMIATTRRGLLVTRFTGVGVIDLNSLLLSGYTRDGLWLVEHGKIVKPVKNFRFTESPLFAFNQVEQLGKPVRVFSPSAPVTVPPIMVRDFAFTALSEAV